MVVNPYAQYQKTQIETADQGKLLLMLYDGALRFLGHANKTLAEQDMEKASYYLLKVQDIVAELMSSLDLDSGEVAASLFRLYEYMYYLLVQTNIKKDPELLPQVESMLHELRDAWQNALWAEQAEQSPAAAAQTQAKAAPKGEAAKTPPAYNQAAGEESGLQKEYKKVNISG